MIKTKLHKVLWLLATESTTSSNCNSVEPTPSGKSSQSKWQQHEDNKQLTASNANTMQVQASNVGVMQVQVSTHPANSMPPNKMQMPADATQPAALPN